MSCRRLCAKNAPWGNPVGADQASQYHIIRPRACSPFSIAPHVGCPVALRPCLALPVLTHVGRSTTRNRNNSARNRYWFIRNRYRQFCYGYGPNMRFLGPVGGIAQTAHWSFHYPTLRLIVRPHVAAALSSSRSAYVYARPALACRASPFPPHVSQSASCIAGAPGICRCPRPPQSEHVRAPHHIVAPRMSARAPCAPMCFLAYLRSIASTTSSAVRASPPIQRATSAGNGSRPMPIAPAAASQSTSLVRQSIAKFPDCVAAEYRSMLICLPFHVVANQPHHVKSYPTM